MKIIDLNQSIYKLCKLHPEAKEILKNLGFTDITKPGMLQTAGRFMTINKGAEIKKIDIEIIKRTFENEGFKIV